MPINVDDFKMDLASLSSHKVRREKRKERMFFLDGGTGGGLKTGTRYEV